MGLWNGYFKKKKKETAHNWQLIFWNTYIFIVFLGEKTNLDEINWKVAYRYSPHTVVPYLSRLLVAHMVRSALVGSGILDAAGLECCWIGVRWLLSSCGLGCLLCDLCKLTPGDGTLLDALLPLSSFIDTLLSSPGLWSSIGIYLKMGSHRTPAGISFPWRFMMVLTASACFRMLL